MRSLKLEQVAVIKFLTLEGASKEEIYSRVKKVFIDFTLPQSKLYKLHYRFLEEGLLGFKESAVYEHDIRKTLESNDPSLLYDGSTFKNGKFTGFSKCEDPASLQGIDTKENSIQFKTEEKLTVNHEINEVKIPKQFKEDLLEFENSNSNEESASCDEMRYEWDNEFNASENEIILSNEELQSDNKLVQSSCNVEETQLSEVTLPTLPILSVPESLHLLQKLHLSLECLLCEGKKFNFLSHLKVHLSTHVKHSIVLSSARALLCKKFCLNHMRGHYHCPSCPMVSPHAKRVKGHFMKFHSKNCNTYRPLAKKCICVDVDKGLFMVLKSKYGDSEPIHVQKFYSEKLGCTRSLCSQELCQNSMKVARQNGNYDLECKHLRDVMLEAKFQPPHFILKRTDFKDSYLEEFEVEQCLILSEKAYQGGVSLIVEWVSERVYFSLFCDQSFAVMERTLVSFDTKESKFSCSCPFEEHFCVFKTISKIYYDKNFIEC